MAISSSTKMLGETQDKVAFSFESPLDIISIYDDAINKGTHTLNPWQMEQAYQFGARRYTAKNPYRLALVAANGSGKDKYVIAPFTLWFILTRLDATCIVTSSSAQQLDTQTERYIKRLSFAINAAHGEEILRVVKRHIYCTKTHSEIILFATDEPGKAEGYHPVTPDAELAIVANEAKSIPDEIFESLLRCSGYSFWLEVSSPGAPRGHFYESHNSDYFIKRRVTSYDCHHISREEIEVDKERLGENSVLFRSKHLALFTSLDQLVVLGREQITQYATDEVPFLDGKFRGGLDIGSGGDETVATVVQGNALVYQDCFIERDTLKQAARTYQVFTSHGVRPENIFCDDNNIGRAVIDLLWTTYNFPVNRFLAQSRAINPRDFLNKGAELWWNFARLWCKGLIKLAPLYRDARVDKKLIDQLCCRKYSQPTGGKIRLVSKQQMKSEGFHSPDRADSLILAFVGVTEADLLGGRPTAPTPRQKYPGTSRLERMMPGGEFRPQTGVVVTTDDARATLDAAYHKSITEQRNAISCINPIGVIRSLYRQQPKRQSHKIIDI